MTQSELLMKLSDVKEELQKRFGIEQIALFGSYAHNEATEESDVDIVIMKIDKKDYFNRVEAKYYLEDLLNKHVDIGYFDSMRAIIKKYVQKDLIIV